MKVGFGYAKSSFSRDKQGTCGPNFFLEGIKTHEILRKQHFFLHMNFFFRKKNENRFWLRKQHFFPFLGYVSYIFPISAFLSKCPVGKYLGAIVAKWKETKNFYGQIKSILNSRGELKLLSTVMVFYRKLSITTRQWIW